MNHVQLLRRIDKEFEAGNFFCMANLVEEYCAEFDDDDSAMNALDAFLGDPFVRNQLPGGFPY